MLIQCATLGLLKSSSEIITDHLDSTFSIQKRSAAQYTLSLDSHSLDLCFLDQRDGKQLLATVTDQLSSGVQAAHIQAADITVPFLQQKMASMSLIRLRCSSALAKSWLKMNAARRCWIRRPAAPHRPWRRPPSVARIPTVDNTAHRDLVRCFHTLILLSLQQTTLMG